MAPYDFINCPGCGRLFNLKSDDQMLDYMSHDCDFEEDEEPDDAA